MIYSNVFRFKMSDINLLFVSTTVWFVSLSSLRLSLLGFSFEAFVLNEAFVFGVLFNALFPPSLRRRRPLRLAVSHTTFPHLRAPHFHRLFRNVCWSTESKQSVIKNIQKSKNIISRKIPSRFWNLITYALSANVESIKTKLTRNNENNKKFIWKWEDIL